MAAQNQLFRQGFDFTRKTVAIRKKLSLEIFVADCRPTETKLPTLTRLMETQTFSSPAQMGRRHVD